ncbi:MAG: PilZ domain-containing protein [Oscillibacter sp.]|nr:PilZ domain-containing protein [Oscillibacter sp.]MBQ9617345.1 PilZ domain-containing protein [Oscillibacter sp.]
MALFGFLKKEKQQEYYFLMDKNSNYLARGALQDNPDDGDILFKVLDGDIEHILRMEIVQVVPTDKTKSVTMGKAVSRRGNVVTIEHMREMGMAVRKNFRMPVDFESFIYPDSGGRYIIKAIDLSSGGIAFYTVANLQAGSNMEVVIPITAEAPVIVRCTILRVMPFAPPIQKYACQFVDMIPDEESMIQEAVFNIQLAHIRDNARQGRS